MKRFSGIMIWVVLLGIVAYIGVREFYLPENPKIYFVNNFELFEGFNYKKELTKKYEQVEKARQSQLDSMRYSLSEYKSYLDQTDMSDLEKLELFNSKKRNYLSTEQRFIEDANAQSSEYDQLIFERLNKYVEEYSKENEIDLLIGVSKSGTVMYGENKFDITDDLLIYVNQKYEG